MIFISYRISDSIDLVGRLDADLTKHFGQNAVFRDMTRLKGGEDWTEVIEHNAQNCNVMLVIIGATWKTTVSDEGDWDGMLRLLNPDDWVRKEITLALKADKAVIPVFLSGAQMPSEGWLKRCELEMLYKKQGVILSSTNYDADLAKLVEFISQYHSDVSKESSVVIEAKANLRESYLQWIVSCHERLEFRGVRYARGGTVSVELKQVYLALQADATNSLERAAARQSLMAEVEIAIQNGEILPAELEHIEWLFIANSPIMPSLESRDRLNKLDPKSKELLNLGEAYFRESQLVVLGDPGSGKTTLARWLSLVSAQALLEGKEKLIVPLSQVDPTTNDEAETISLGLTRLPILVRISEYAEERQRQSEAGNAPPTLLEFLGRQTWLGSPPVWGESDPKRGDRIDPKLLNQLFRETLEANQALIVLDGLDEVPASALRDEIVEEVDTFTDYWIRRRQIVSQIQTYGNEAAVFFASATSDTPGNRLLVTSRIAGYYGAALRGDLAHVTVEPMSSEAVARFIKNWMWAVHKELAPPNDDQEAIRKKADAESGRFLTVLNEPRQRGGRELATNPLLCGILATVFRQYGGQLPQERVELYGQAVDLLLEVWMRRQRDDEASKLLKYELFDFLEPLAEHIHRHEPTGLIPEPQLRQLALRFLAESRGDNPLRPTPQLRKTVDEMIRVVKEDVGLIAARGEGVYGFLHLTFQEYLAARAIVRDPALACSRITEQLGDARWREAIRLGLGYLSIEHPQQLTDLTKQLLVQQTALQDLLPQAALTIIGSFPDLREIHPTLVGALTDDIIATYAIRELLEKLPRRRELLEWAAQRLIESGAQEAVEDSFIKSLDNASKFPDQAAATAELIRRLDFYSPKLFKGLLQALAHDLSEWRWPIHAALRIAMTPRDREENSRVEPAPGILPFREFLLQEKEIVEHIRGDFDWLRVVFALYGGLGDYEAAKGIQTYYQIAIFLQQEDAARERYRQAYVAKWSMDDNQDDDFIYNMAVFLDTKGKTLTNRGGKQLIFNPKKIYRNSEWNNTIKANLRKGMKIQDLITDFGTATNILSRAEADLDLIRWILIDEKTFADIAISSSTEKLTKHLSILQNDLSDAVVRTGPHLVAALASISKMIEPEQFWCLFEASADTIFRRGAMPFVEELLKLRGQMPSLLNHYILAEALALYCQGWGDDGVYNTAVFLDNSKISADQLLAAHSVISLSPHLNTQFTMAEWPVALLPPVVIPENDIPPGILNNILLIPSILGFVRSWSLTQVLRPIIEANPNLVPEILAFALGDAHYKDSRSELFGVYAPELLHHPTPGVEIYLQIQALKQPYHRVRALLRLSESWPERRDQLLQEAEYFALQINTPLQSAQAYEWLAAISSAEKREKFWQQTVGFVEKIDDFDEQARSWGRLGLLATAGQEVNCFKNALAAAAKIDDEFKRGTTIRLLRKVAGVISELSDGFNSLMDDFKDPVLKSRAAEEWGSVFRHLTPYLRDDKSNLELWAILSLTAEADQDAAQNAETSDELWIQLANDPTSIATVDKLSAISENGILKCTPLVAQCLDRLLAAGNVSTVESFFPRLHVSSAEVVPFLQRQIRSSSELIASVSALLLAEQQGLSSYVMSGVIKCLLSTDDLTRHRASYLLYGQENTKPINRGSLIGQEALNTFFESGMGETTSRKVGNATTWFCERLLYDSAEQIAEWAKELRQNPNCNSCKRGLSSIHHIEDDTWKQLLIELKQGDGNVQERILTSMARLAHMKYLDSIKTESLSAIISQIEAPELEKCDYLAIELTDLLAVLLDTLKSQPDATVNISLVIKAREMLEARHAFGWASICRITNPTQQYESLKKVGDGFYVEKSGERTRWENAASVAKSGMDDSRFLELLCEWAVVVLSKDLEGPDKLNYERYKIIELFAGSATLAPARFLRYSSTAQLRSLLIAAVLKNRFYPVRSDAVRLLGYLRHLSLDILPALRSALEDAEYVREAALDAISLFRRMDSDVLNELKDWLTDESGLVAYATARLLTSIGRHTQTTGRLEKNRSAATTRQDIVETLAEAVRDPRSNRRLDFGANNFSTPEVPRLCDFFYDCMLKVAGYDDAKSSQMLSPIAQKPLMPVKN